MNSINQKHPHRINTIDLLIIVAVIITVVFVSKTIISDISNNNIINVEYTVKVSGVAFDSASKLNVSDKLRANNTNNFIGKLKEISVSPSVSYVFNYNTDRFVSVENNNKYDMYLLVEAGSKLENNQYKVNGNIISANKKLVPVLPFGYTDAIIISVKPVNTEVLTPERSAENNEE